MFKGIEQIVYAAWLKFFIYALLLTGIYYSTYDYLIRHDWSREDYSASILIPIIFLYLIWEKRNALFDMKSCPSWAGISIIIAGLVCFWLGELGGEYFSLYFSSWLILVGIFWAHLGWQKLKTIVFPVALLLAMFPLPNFIHGKLSFKLKLLSSQLGVQMMQLVGMTAYREGNVIDLGFTQLQVVDACSGLRYLIPLIILGVLLAYFFLKEWWKRIVFVISTIPIAVLINGLRIFSVGFLYQFWGPMVAEGFFHDFSGWFIFMTSLLLLLGEMWVLKRLMAKGEGQKAARSEERRAKGEGLKAKGEGKSERDGSGWLRGFFRPPQFIVAVVLLSVTLAASYGIEFREKIPISKSLDGFPMRIGTWQGDKEIMEQRIIDTLDLSDYTVINYQNTDGKRVNFYVAYYESQRKGESIHTPGTCLPGSGWRFEEAGAVNIPVSLHDRKTMPVNRAYMQKGDYQQLSYYWFPMRGRILTNAYEMKIYTFWDALTRQRTDGALVRLITPVYSGESVTDADERLKAFAGEVVPVLDGFLPK